MVIVARRVSDFAEIFSRITLIRFRKRIISTNT